MTGNLKLLCRKCTREGHFIADKPEQAIKAAMEAGWVKEDGEIILLSEHGERDVPLPKNPDSQLLAMFKKLLMDPRAKDLGPKDCTQLELPQGVEDARKYIISGLNFRAIRSYDFAKGVSLLRVDILFRSGSSSYVCPKCPVSVNGKGALVA